MIDNWMDQEGRVEAGGGDARYRLAGYIVGYFDGWIQEGRQMFR